tara:strand:+ start:8668 stop:9705 length:1038 start_codon:yes stop_codon:yes gene_type:complete
MQKNKQQRSKKMELSLDDSKWIKVGNDLLMPDIAALVRDRLEGRRGLSSTADAEGIGKMFLRQLEEGESPSTGGLRLSSSGKCQRALAYDYHHYKPNGFKGDGSSPIVFATGDILEMIIVTALEEAIIGTPLEMYYTGLNQKTVSLGVPLTEGRQAKVSGHPDGMMRVPAYNETLDEFTMVNLILEIKSMSDYGFKMFRKKGLTKDDSYFYQQQSYQLAMTQEGKADFNWSYVLAFGKNVTSKDCELEEDGSVTNLHPLVGGYLAGCDDTKREIQDRLREVILSDSPEEFPRVMSPATAPKKKGQLGFPCDWCSHWKTCWPTAREEVVSSGFFQRSNKLKLIVGE